MAKILLLEDDPVLGKGLALNLETAGHAVSWETTVSGARAKETTNQFDLAIFDVNLPDGSGMDFCKELRASGTRMPIMMLTARTDEDSVVAGFECGANDYIKKPFSTRELLVRLQTQLKEPFPQDEKIRLGPITVMIEQRKVLIDGEDIDFNRREFDIFLHLLKSPGAVLSREQLIQGIEGADNILDRTIDSHFSHIRAKLKKRGIQKVAIRSVYGVGYTLETT